MSHHESSSFGGTMGGNEYLSHYSQSASPRSRYEPEKRTCCGVQNVSNMERVLSVVAGLGVAAAGLKCGRTTGLLLSAIGAGLVWRGLSGRCQAYAALGINTADHNAAIGVPAKEGCKLERTIIVNQSPEKLYEFWRRLDNLPRVMRHLKYVESMDNEHSHWKAEGAFGADVEWDAEILNDRANELIAWRSIPGGDVDTAGSVHFRPLGHDGATEVTISMKYNPPAGKIGAKIASLLGEGLEEKLDEDLSRFKEVMETGMEPVPDIATTPYSNRNSPMRDQFT